MSEKYRILRKIPIIGRVYRKFITLENCINELQYEINVLKTHSNELQYEIKVLKNCINENTVAIGRLNRFEVSDEFIDKMNYMHSARGTIWGDKNRLHISELSSVYTCFFDTNSGDITVGDYTFAGSGVSILAGSHDKELIGLPRRDAELKEGCDIVIGKAVWLGSNSTILGPATIGDNAVIAAGAVVIPGTKVPANTVYGGVPAKCIKTINIEKLDNNSQSVIKAIEREGGALFTRGWTDKRPMDFCGKSKICHRMVSDSAEILLKNLEKCFLECLVVSNLENVKLNLHIQIDDNKKDLLIETKIAHIDISDMLKKNNNADVSVLNLTLQSADDVELFVLIRNEED